MSGATRATGAALLALLLIQLAIGLLGVNAPVRWGHQGYHMGEHGIGARNVLDWGEWRHSLHHGDGPPPDSSLNFHHVSMLQVPLAATFWLFGEEPWAARLVPIAFSLLAAAGIFAFTRRARGDPEAVAVTAAFVLNPLHAAFCNLPDIQIVSIAAALWLAYAFLRLLGDGPRWPSVLLVWGMTFLGGMFDWPFYTVYTFLWLVTAWELRPWSPLARARGPERPAWTRRQLNAARGALFVSGLILVAILAQHFYFAEKAGMLRDLMGSAQSRGDTGELGEFAEFAITRLAYHHSPALIYVFAAWFLVIVVLRRFDRGTRLVLGWTIGQTVWLFRFGSEFRIHEYRSYWFVVPFAFAAGDLIGGLGRLTMRALRRWAQDVVGDAGRRLGALLLRVFAYGWPFVLVLGPVADFGVDLVALSRIRAGCTDTNDYDPQSGRMAGAQVIAELAGDDAQVFIHDAMQPRLEIWWLVDAPSDVIWSASAARRAVTRGQHVFVMLWSEQIKDHPEWARLANMGRVLLIGQVAVVEVHPEGEGPRSIESVQLVEGPRRPWLERWLYSPATAPLYLVPGDRTVADELAERIGASEEVRLGITRGEHPMLQSLPPGREF